MNATFSRLCMLTYHQNAMYCLCGLCACRRRRPHEALQATPTPTHEHASSPHEVADEPLYRRVQDARELLRPSGSLFVKDRLGGLWQFTLPRTD
jgi:hypothetical protein